MQILIVDDCQDIRNILSDLLKRRGHNVIEAIDGQDGLWKFAQNSNIDLVITDFEMPNKNGQELAHEIRKSNSHIPILLHTGYDEAKKTPDINAVVPKGDFRQIEPYLK